MTLATSTADAATVNLAGTLTWTIDDAGLRAFVDVLAAEASPAPTADEKEQAIAGSSGPGSRAASWRPRIQVVAEDGGWLVCTDILTEGAAE